ncbi:MAG: hypothetical protein LBI99_02625 [Propionibacteriaceae bacterium]|jgi:hypothetical protein|nr:hypothetical protein [Propionibacteriaceae bacterium]
MATATVSWGGERNDVAVPAGTTVAGLLAMLQIDTSAGRLLVTLSDGTAVDPASVIGGDLPLGVLLAVADTKASQEAAQIAKAQSSGLRQAVAAVGTSMFAVTADAVLAAGLSGAIALDGLTRYGLAALSLLTVASLVFFAHSILRPWGAVTLPLLAGATALAFLDPSNPYLWRICAPLVCCAAFCVALAAWLWRRRGANLAAMLFWAALALLSSLAAALGWGIAVMSPVLLALAALAVNVAPEYVLRIPDAQLVDMPLLTTFAPTLRVPAVEHPAQITDARVRRTLNDAQDILDAVIIGSVLLSGAMAPFVAFGAGFSSLEGWAGMATLLCSLASLCFVNPTTSHLARIAPRIGAAVICGASVWLVLGSGPLGFGILVGLAAVCFLASCVEANENGAARLGMLSDALRGAGMVLVLPAGALAAGFFEIIWRSTS